ncbi:hypothetical protein B0T14DRAFT_281820 [Immersiella caudata]|uniref:Uncharacterized protein n=1 Tax=Immersiella caudata TaxID=314043 RepID=A0AA39WDV8_9PEZI|nr:hypothetical protein B0T14DRAFT_281820 [Immersiella caudata]
MANAIVSLIAEIFILPVTLQATMTTKVRLTAMEDDDESGDDDDYGDNGDLDDGLLNAKDLAFDEDADDLHIYVVDIPTSQIRDKKAKVVVRPEEKEDEDEDEHETRHHTRASGRCHQTTGEGSQSAVKGKGKKKDKGKQPEVRVELPRGRVVEMESGEESDPRNVVGEASHQRGRRSASQALSHKADVGLAVVAISRTSPDGYRYTFDEGVRVFPWGPNSYADDIWGTAGSQVAWLPKQHDLTEFEGWAFPLG